MYSHNDLSEMENGWKPCVCSALLTFNKAPNSKDEEGDEGVVGEVIHGGDHHTWGA